MADNQVLNAILETMASFVSEEERKNIKKDAELAIQKLEELSNLFDLSDQNMYENKSSYYSAKAGWNSYLYRIKSVQTYPKALHLITEILDLMRGQPLLLEVYKIERNPNGGIDSIKKFVGKESEVQLKQKKTQYGGSFSEEIHYLKQSLEQQEIVDKAFIKHFENFENLAKAHYQKHNKEKRYANFNEGHIIEAYQRHIVWNNDTDYTDRISRKQVAIMLYYSMNSTGWWQGGDVGYTQIKGDSTRLATQKSIRMVANKLIQMYKNPATFTPEEFHRMFSVKDLEEMAEYQKLAKRSLKNLLQNELKNLDISVDEN